MCESVCVCVCVFRVYGVYASRVQGFRLEGVRIWSSVFAGYGGLGFMDWGFRDGKIWILS